MFLSPEGFTSVDSKLYIDWIRFYDTEDNIPEEKFADNVASGIITINNATNNTVNAIYDMSGRRIENPRAGLYIIKTQQGTRKVIIK